MDVSHMREVLVLAEHLNFTTAAAELFVSQPTLTRHVNAMESELGVKLFKRTNHVVELTRAGTVAVKAFEKIVGGYDALLADVALVEDDEANDLRLGMVYYGTTAYYGYPLLEVFTERFPDVRVSTITAQTTQIYKHLHKGVIDIGLTITSSDYGDDVERVVVDTIPLYAFMQTDHPLARRESIGLEELARQKLVLNSIPVDRPHHILQLFERHGLMPTDIVYLDHIDTLLPTLSRTGGIFIGSMLLTAIPQQHHEFVAIEADDFAIDVALVHLKDNDNPNIARLVECIPDIRKPTM
ncbi:MAG: LysR family transcriptional regulator [Eggerthellaceae bacterium]|nr:LysR family transcriptional regulator [Eggerthellaceae bacterium]